MSIRDHSLEHNNRGHKCDFTLEYFKREHNCKTMLDIGAGNGLNCAWATDQHGYTATGIEIDSECTKVHDDIVIHNFVTDGVCKFDKTFDLGWSVATSEHIDELGADNYVKTFLACKWVVFTWCPPGYGGTHHVNERSQSYWIEKFHANGFEFNSSISNLIKEKSLLKMIKSPPTRILSLKIKSGSLKQVSKRYLRFWATVFHNPSINQS